MPGSVANVGALAQQVVLSRDCHRKSERHVVARLPDTALQRTKFDVQNLAQIVISQRMENNGFVDSVDELGREASACRFVAGVSHFGRKPVIYLYLIRGEAYAG